MNIYRWLFMPLLALLTACVSYYQPEAALEDGVYYPEDDPSYRYNADDYYFSRVVVYPWVSLDSFYFGYWPYSSYRYGYWPYPGYGFSFVYPDEPGFAAGYYAFYSPWYVRGYSTYYYPPAWRPYWNNCHHHERCDKHDNDGRNAGNDRYAGGGDQVYGDPGGGEENAFYSNNVRNKMGRAVNSPSTRYVAKTKTGPAGSQGRAVKGSETARTGRNRARTVYSPSRGAAADMPRQGSSSMFSGHDSPSPSFSPPPHSRSSDYGKSSRSRDRD